MSRHSEMAKAYDHHQVEDRLYRFWEEGGYFQPALVKGRPPFVEPERRSLSPVVVRGAANGPSDWRLPR